MNCIKTYFLLFSIILLLKSVAAQDNFCGIQNTSFQNREELTYKVYYNMGALWVPAGVVRFTVNQKQYNGKQVYHIVGDGRSYKSYEWFFKVRDRYETYLDVETLLPVKFIRNVEEGGTKIYNNVSFDQEAGQAVSHTGTYSIPRCVQDVLSAVYYARNLNYSKCVRNTKIPFTMFLDDKVYDMYIRFHGREKIKTRHATFNTIKFSPLLVAGTIFKGGEKMTVWATDDANRIPVRIESPILIGTVKVDLIEYRNLRNPMKGLINVH